MNAQSGPSVMMQGIEVPQSSVDPAAFVANTRRKRFVEKTISNFAGLGATDQFAIIQSGIIAALDLHISGTLVVTPSTGSVATTNRWPYDLIRAIRLSANGTTNIINCSGGKLAAHRFMELGDVNDRGVQRGIGGASPGTVVNQGTLSLPSESWGVGQNVTAIGAGSYDVELYVRLPLAMDLVNLLGAIFSQTQATAIEVGIDWAPPSDLLTIVAPATAAFSSLSVLAEGIVFSIPYGANGNIVVPNLSAFHKLVQYNDYSAGQGAYRSMLLGQGVGQLLERCFWQLWNNGRVGTPLAITAANFGPIGWQYGGSEQPEVFNEGTMLRMYEDRLYSTDLGAAGFAVQDFASHWLARDSVDESTATNLAMLLTPVPSLTTPVLEVVQETLVAGVS